VGGGGASLKRQKSSPCDLFIFITIILVCRSDVKNC
jgi:hypothetical protein